MWHVLIFLLLLGVANGTPVLLRLAMGARYAQPLDGGLILPDGYPLFGPSKTLRGIASSLLVTAVTAGLLGYTPGVGMGIAAAAMLGDLFSSFIKRRLGLKSSHNVYGLDQIPESLLPAVLYRIPVGISWLGMMPLLLAFFVLDVILTEWFQRLESRRRQG